MLMEAKIKMLGIKIISTMFEYDHHINHRLIELAMQVKPEEWDAPNDAGQRSLHETLFHLLVVGEEYLSLCLLRQPIWESRLFEHYPDAASLADLNDLIHDTYQPLLERLTDDQLTSRATALMPSGRVESVMIWHLLLHSLYHSAQHRSECASMLTKYGYSPGFIDFYGFGSWGAE